MVNKTVRTRPNLSSGDVVLGFQLVNCHTIGRMIDFVFLCLFFPSVFTVEFLLQRLYSRGLLSYRALASNSFPCRDKSSFCRSKTALLTFSSLVTLFSVFNRSTLVLMPPRAAPISAIISGYLSRDSDEMARAIANR